MRPNLRGQQTRERLQRALLELIRERGYEAATIQEIVSRAGVGRTTFYLHYAGKDELFVGCHETILREFHFGPLRPLSREELLAPDPPPGMVQAYHHLKEVRMLLLPIFQSKDSLTILRQIRDGRAREIEASLHAAFPGVASATPIDLLASYLAGAQISLTHWWLEKRHPYSPEAMAQTLHRLQRTVISEAFRVDEAVE